MVKNLKPHKIILVFFAFLFSSLLLTASIAKPVSAVTEESCICTNTYSNGKTKTEEGSDGILFGDSNGCYCGGIKGIINIGINIFTGLVAVAGTTGIILVGVQYMSARDNEQQLAAAKRRLVSTIVGIIAFAMLDLAANLFLPGGLSDSSPKIVKSTSTRKSIAVATPTATTSKTPALVNRDKPLSKKTSKDSSSSTTPDGSSCASYGVGVGITYHVQWESGAASTIWKGGKSSCTNRTIRKSACPMIAALNAIIKVTGCKLTPNMFAQEMKSYTNNFSNKKGLWYEDKYGCWSNYGWTNAKYFLDKYGIQYKAIADKAGVKEALKKGHAVIASGARGKKSNTPQVYSPNGHWVMFSAIDGNTVTVENPANNSYHKVSLEDALKYNSQKYEVWK